MPDFALILAFYKVVSTCSLSGALPGECRAAARDAREQVAEGFLSARERRTLTELNRNHRRGRLRLGELRFRAWERANPDIAAVLQRKADTLVLA